MLPLFPAQPADGCEHSFGVDEDATEMCWNRTRAYYLTPCPDGSELAHQEQFGVRYRRFQAEINLVANIDFC
jgi:hypothetical protein